MRKSHIIRYIIIIVALSHFGCSDTKVSSAWDGFNPYKDFNKTISQYVRVIQKFTIEKKSGNPKVFVDFSDGMVQAYTNNPTNKDIIQAITNRLVSTDIEWYSLGNSKIEKLDYSANELFNKVTNPSAYKDLMAPIELALKEITSSQNDALLITDFEEYTEGGIEQFQNYPKEYFTSWLKAGNSITFFYTDYQETNPKSKIKTTKHLYFTVFTFGTPDKYSMVSFVKDALAGRNYTKEFTMGGKPFEIQTKYPSNDATGIANSTFQKWINFHYNGLNELRERFEVIGINKPWNEDLDEYIKIIIQKENRVFLSNLFLNVAGDSYYTLRDLDIRMYDISQDFDKFSKYLFISQNAPTFTLDEGKNKVWDANSAANPIIIAGYEKNTDKIKSEWLYQPVDLGSLAVAEIFSLDGQLFNDHLMNDPKNIHLKTLFDEKYKIKGIKNPEGLFRIDIIHKDISFNFSNEQLKDFEWSSATQKGKVNNALAEAIRNTLQHPDITPQHKALYSYYIKFNFNSKP